MNGRIWAGENEDLSNQPCDLGGCILTFQTPKHREIGCFISKPLVKDLSCSVWKQIPYISKSLVPGWIGSQIPITQVTALLIIPFMSIISSYHHIIISSYHYHHIIISLYHQYHTFLIATHWIFCIEDGQQGTSSYVEKNSKKPSPVSLFTREMVKVIPNLFRFRNIGCPTRNDLFLRSCW